MAADDNIVMRLSDELIEKLRDYKYLRYLVNLGKKNQTAEINIWK